MSTVEKEKERILAMYQNAKQALGLSTIQELADQLEVERETLYLWASRGKVPIERAIALEALLAKTKLPLTRFTIAPWAYR